MARSYDGVTVEVVNWEKYNPRTDSKKPSWFRLDNTFMTGQKYFDLSAGQKLLGVLLMSLVSQSNGSSITLNYSYLKTFTGLAEDDISKAIGIYIDRGTLRVSRARVARVPSVSRNNSPATDGRTDEHNGRTNITNTACADAIADEFDFEVCYQNYPRRIGKAEGLARAKKLITSIADYDSFCRAIKNYAEYIRAQGTEEKYIKHFSSFVGVKDKEPWRDWLDVVPPKPTPNNPAYRRMAGNQHALNEALKSIGEGGDEQAS